MAEQGLRLETICNILENARSNDVRLAGAKACKLWGKGPKTKEEWEMVERWAWDNRWWYRAAGLYAYGPARAPLDLLKMGLLDGNYEVVESAIYSAQGKSFDAGFIVETLCNDGGIDPRKLGNLPEKMKISKYDIKEMLGSFAWENRYLAVKACANKTVPQKWLFDILETEFDGDVREAAVDVLRSMNISRRTLKRQWNKCRTADLSMVFAGRDDMMDVIKENISGLSSYVLAETCEGVHFSLEDIDGWRRSLNYGARLVAAYACIGRPDVPDEWVKQLMGDGSYKVRCVARRARKGRNIPPVRSFKPPELVYKKCLGDIIITATIPADAEVRGKAYGKARTDKATIVGIDGDFYGEQVGVAYYDSETIYRIGDEVSISNFDPGDDEQDAGFHFFSSLKQARLFRR